MSHYQQYLNAIKQKENSSSPSPSPTPSIHRKPTGTSTPLTSPSTNSLPRQQHPVDRLRSVSHTPATTTTHPSASQSPISTIPSKSASLISHSARAVSGPPTTTAAATSTKYGLSKTQIDDALHIALTLQNEATTQHSKRPFSAVLLGPDNSTVLLTHFSISHVRHAESELARLAADHFSTTYLSTCTLVTTWEPCAMCSGTIYWSGIGRVLYAASEARLRELTGSNNDENMTMSLPCRTVFEAGQRKTEVIGPVPDWEEKVVHESGKWWKEHNGKAASIRSGGSMRNGVNGHGLGERASVVTTWTGEESVLSSIGEDGEYKADLNIDWMR